VAGRKTIHELQRENDLQVRALQTAQKGILKKYKEQDKVEVTVSPMYAPYFGNNQPVELNGCKIYVPSDGKGYKIPKSFAAEVRSRIRKVDDQLLRAKRLSNTSSNIESYVGERGTDLMVPS
jgi:hypothetical protein